MEKIENLCLNKNYSRIKEQGDNNMNELSTQSPKRTGNVINVIIIILLILSNFWFFYKIQILEDSIELLENQVFEIQSDIFVLDSRLDYVTPLAENGNRWAHSHGW